MMSGLWWRSVTRDHCYDHHFWPLGLFSAEKNDVFIKSNVTVIFCSLNASFRVENASIFASVLIFLKSMVASDLAKFCHFGK
jgi:hypothetical protein